MLNHNGPKIDLPDNINSWEVILCPLNINNTHWVLVVFEKVLSRTFLIDSYKNGCDPISTKATANSLNVFLNEYLKCKKKFLNSPPFPIPLQ